jgi:hypothetical protein
MFCEQCGTKIEEGSRFCQNCGEKIGDSPEVSTQVTFRSAPIDDGAFYSKEWRIRNFFSVVALPKVDVLIDDDTFYLIKLPNYSGSTIGGILGFLIGSIFGAAIGASIGESNDRKKRDWYRSAWIDKDGKLVSREYTRDIYMQIPLGSLKNNISFGKSKVFLNINGKKITLGRRPRSFQAPDRTERNRLKEKLNSYVL